MCGIRFSDPYPDNEGMPSNIHRVALTGATAERFMKNIWNMKEWEVIMNLSATTQYVSGEPAHVYSQTLTTEVKGKFNAGFAQYGAGYFWSDHTHETSGKVYYGEPGERVCGRVASTVHTIDQPPTEPEVDVTVWDVEHLASLSPSVYFAHTYEYIPTYDDELTITEEEGGTERGNVVVNTTISTTGGGIGTSVNGLAMDVVNVWYKSATDIDVFVRVDYVCGDLMLAEFAVVLANAYTEDGDELASGPYYWWYGWGLANNLVPVTFSFYGVTVEAQMSQHETWAIDPEDSGFTIEDFSLSYDVEVSEYYTYD